MGQGANGTANETVLKRSDALERKDVVKRSSVVKRKCSGTM